ncbi:odorant receptor 2a isoform X1 [Monomorium pharaonis]|uniref:odorant receptor 2a isoform X1 n=1 Tax=Monomorium pharaonis TaxID=307658 RepID=UPI00174679C1|nr:odorant receptor 2a isoform X1 [Monomorium pharaonis]
MVSKTDSMIPDGTVSRSIEIGLRVIGVWPDSSYMVLRRAFWMITLTMAQTFQYRYFLIHVRTDDLSHLMDGLSTTMSYSLLLLKLTIFWINRRIFYDILAMMAQDRSECANEWAVYSMSRTTDVSHRSSNLIIGLYSMSVFLYGTGVLVAHADEPDEELAVPARELFLKMELPFESNASPAYELVMVTQFFHQLAAATIVGVLNALIVSLILHVGGQIDIMCRGLVEISSGDDTFDLRMSTIKALIRRHQRIIALSADIETLFSYIALMQFLWNTLVICCLGFLIVTAIGDTQGSTMMIKSLFFYVVITLEAFIFCYAGEYLTAKGRMIGDAAYEAKWYNSNPTQSRIILLLILRSQRKLTITIGKFMDLSLERFTTVRCTFRITFSFALSSTGCMHFGRKYTFPISNSIYKLLGGNIFLQREYISRFLFYLSFLY